MTLAASAGRPAASRGPDPGPRFTGLDPIMGQLTPSGSGPRFPAGHHHPPGMPPHPAHRARNPRRRARAGRRDRPRRSRPRSRAGTARTSRNMPRQRINASPTDMLAEESGVSQPLSATHGRAQINLFGRVRTVRPGSGFVSGTHIGSRSLSRHGVIAAAARARPGGGLYSSAVLRTPRTDRHVRLARSVTGIGRRQVLQQRAGQQVKQEMPGAEIGRGRPDAPVRDELDHGR
jgi:hypothetical protein